ncbi:MAG: DNA mismatch repair protein MutS [Ruminococcus sp.]|nr:DNA mismatch repair protein MutS [Ruminococcus sp.]
MLKLCDVDLEKASPMIKQYAEVKLKHPKHILFYRLGDFYEMFFEDASIVSKELELTLTGRDCGMSERAPMCGVPFHSCDVYIKKLIDKGYTVAICEQMEDPSTAKGLVKREITRVITPGTLTESSMLDEGSNNYLCALYYKAKCFALSFVDISTGSVHLFTFKGKNARTEVINELAKYTPSEVITNCTEKSLNEIAEFIDDKLHSYLQFFTDDAFSVDIYKKSVLTQFSASSFEELGLDENSLEANVICGIFGYVENTQKAAVGRFTEITRHNKEQTMGIGVTAVRNLELVETLRNKDKKGTLFWVLDKTKTSMGRRMLRTSIEQPLANPIKIMARLDAVDALVSDSLATQGLTELLKSVFDIERLTTRVLYKNATPRDVKSLSRSVLALPQIKAQLDEFDSSLLSELNDQIFPCEEISTLVENAIVDEPPANVKEGGVIKEGFNAELDELRSIIANGKGIIEDIAEKEREKTGIKKLKLGYNRVFGYYLEVSKSFVDQVPSYYIRKQTLVNYERYVTDEIKDAENMILGASDKIIRLEQDIFSEIIAFIADFLVELQSSANAVAYIDMLCSFAEVSVSNNYVKPEISVDGIIDIRNGRHPVVELMQRDEIFVPNDAYLDLTDNRLSIITGPNMSGKSTYMRQVALITLMAQIGCFVPCDYAKISVVDQIFTRVGASDDLTSGQSTFMVEMSEVAEIVSLATKNSLVILDEVGRGTSTYDGLSIARAVVEYIAGNSRLGCKTLFATHYHELIELEGNVNGVRNLSVAVKQVGGSIKFLRKIVSGGADESYGIEVAKLAGLPKAIVSRADELLCQFESEARKEASSSPDDQLSFDEFNENKATKMLKRTNIDEMNDTELREFVKDLIKYVNMT